MRTLWFVEPKDEHTNEVISLMRPGEQIDEKDVTLPGNVVKQVKAWRVSFADLTFLERSKRNMLNYQAYEQQGGGKITPHTYLLKKSSNTRRQKEMRKAAKQLRELKK